jgi:hypothetical protein
MSQKNKNILFNPMSLELNKIKEIHELLLNNDMNKYMLFIAQNNPKREITILRPATHKETQMVDKNYLDIPITTRLPCPCIMINDNKILSLGFPPLKFLGLNWREEIPNYSDWIKITNNLKKCELCGSNIILGKTNFCCNFHHFLYLKINISDLKKKGWDLQNGILL